MWVCTGHGSGIDKHNTVNIFCASDSCLHVTPQVTLVHSFVTMELHSKQSSTKEPAIVAEGYLMCQCFSYIHSRGSTPLQKKKDMIFIGLISKANGAFKLHIVKALHPKLS